MSAWPLWSAGLLAGLGLIFAGRPSRLRRNLGVGLLALTQCTIFTFQLWVENGCYEGYADSTGCDLASGSFLLGAVLLGGIALAMFWGLFGLVRSLARRRGNPAPYGR